MFSNRATERFSPLSINIKLNLEEYHLTKYLKHGVPDDGTFVRFSPVRYVEKNSLVIVALRCVIVEGAIKEGCWEIFLVNFVLSGGS